MTTPEGRPGAAPPGAHAPRGPGAPRSAIFGGTFDPPHNAHLALAHAALAALALDDVRWVPAGLPWQKVGGGARAVTPAAHRVAMVERAIAGEARFRLERLEVERSGPSYMIDTVEALAAREPGRAWVLLIGQDQVARLPTWHRWRELLARVTLAVANRPGAAAAPAPEVAAVLAAAPRSTLPLPMLDISATDIRARIAAGRDVAALVPAEVAGYIARHGLYRG
ncbi:MAG: nicotinate (nicotinamide) nucleotide adenylyltransferase [Rubrivivax sp.]|nr:nicotinate (nicotinamide) nucleotide adenylyltransferase [Rubrivivax sp.]